MPWTTTDETWAVNGVILNKLAYNFSGLGGRLGTPSIRGANSSSPLGADRFRPHWYGPRDESWEMWVSAADPLTDIFGIRAQTNQNLDVIKALFGGNMSVPLAVTRVVRLPSGLTTRTCSAFLRDVIAVNTVKGGHFHRITVPVTIPSGLWLGSNATSTLSAGATITVAGSASVQPNLLTLSGNITVANTTTATGFAYTGVACTINPGTGQSVPASAIAGLVPTSQQLLTLAPGPNVITISGGGTITIDYTVGFL